MATETRTLIAARLDNTLGVQRVAALGEVAQNIEGLPHDGFYPIRRFMRWVLDDAALGN